MKTARDELIALVRKGWSAEKAKDIIARDLPIGSGKSEVISYIESQLYPETTPYLEMLISNPKPDQLIPAGTVFGIEVVNHTCADEVITCIMSNPKVTGLVTFAFWFRNKKLTLISIQNKSKII